MTSASGSIHLERIELYGTCRYAQQLHDCSEDTIYNQKHEAWLEAAQTYLNTALLLY